MDSDFLKHFWFPFSSPHSNHSDHHRKNIFRFFIAYSIQKKIKCISYWMELKQMSEIEVTVGIILTLEQSSRQSHHTRTQTQKKTNWFLEIDLNRLYFFPFNLIDYAWFFLYLREN